MLRNYRISQNAFQIQDERVILLLLTSIPDLRTLNSDLSVVKFTFCLTGVHK